ncbi:MAG TPA: alpha/beta fold hydrolase [Streptosporangiales bacterium]
MASLLLLHAMGSSGRMWRAQLEAFAGRHEVVAPDLPGHGHAAGPFTMDEAVAKSRSVLADLSDPLYVAGVSLGAAVAMRVALAEPERVAGLLLSGTPLRFSRVVLAVQRAMTALLPIATTAATSARLTRPADQRDADALVADVIAAGKRTQAQALRELTGQDLTPRLPEIKARTLVCCGGEDRANLASARLLADRLPNATLRLVPGAGHLWNLQRPELCTDMLTELVEG